MQVEVDQHVTVIHLTFHQFPRIITTIDNMTDRDSRGITTMTRDLNTVVGRNGIKEVFPRFAKHRQQFSISSLKCFRNFFSKTSTSPINT